MHVRVSWILIGLLVPTSTSFAKLCRGHESIIEVLRRI
jgi:hypothetical protein